MRFASPDDRVAVAERITDIAVGRSLSLTPPAMHHTPARYIRADGSYRLHPASRIAQNLPPEPLKETEVPEPVARAATQSTPPIEPSRPRLGLCSTDRVLSPERRGRLNRDLADLVQSRRDEEAKSGSIRLSS